MKSPYNITYRGIKLDPYRIFELYGITHPAAQHSIKKLLRAGKSHKSLKQDIQESIDTLERWKQMISEDEEDKLDIPSHNGHDLICVCCGETVSHSPKCPVVVG